MKSRVLLMLGFVLPFSCVGLIAQDMESGHRPEPPQAGIHWAKGQAPTGQAGSSPNLLYHGGPIMGDVTVTPIFWGPSWGNQDWVGDKMTGLVSFYTGIKLSTYAATVGEYSDSAHTPLTSNIAFLPDCHRSVPGQRTANRRRKSWRKSARRFRIPLSMGITRSIPTHRGTMPDSAPGTAPAPAMGPRAVRVFLQSGR